MNGEPIESSRGLSRRDLLKRGGLIGAAAVWTVPLVQAVSMTPAHADTPSAPSGGGGGNNPPPMTDVPTTTVPSSAPPPTTPTGKPTDPSSSAISPDTSTAHSSSSAAVDAAASTRIDKNRGSGVKTNGTGALADTGVSVPVLPTIIAGGAAVALGAGVVAAARPRTQNDESGE